jgi:hypothetical protein
MVTEGVFIPLSPEDETLVWERVVADGHPRTREGLSSWLIKQAKSKPGTPAQMIARGRDYITANPQVVQQGLNILGAMLRSRRPGP